MNTRLTCTAAALMLGLSSVVMGAVTPASAHAAAAEASLQTATFSVENMTCATCPITVRLAMEGVEGVRSAEVDFEAGSATVVFDPSVTDAEAIAAASMNAGYPATPTVETPEEARQDF